MASNIFEFLERLLSPKLAALETDINNLKSHDDNLRQENWRIKGDMKELGKKNIEIIERLAGLEARMNSLAEDTWLKLENIYLKKQTNGQSQTLLND